MAITAEKLSIANYNKLDNIPVINQDLSASDFTPVANTYYRHTGATTDTFTQGVIYYYDGTEYKALDGSGSGSGGISDVQVNGTSVVTEGVANIPPASTSANGVVTTDAQTFTGVKTIEASASDSVLLVLKSKTPSSGRSYSKLRFDSRTYSGGTYSFTVGMNDISTLQFRHASQYSGSNYAFVNYAGQSFLINLNTGGYTGGQVNCGSTGYQLYLRSKACYNAVPTSDGTLMSTPKTWSSGTSGSVTLSGAGLYEVQSTIGLGSCSTIINWDGTATAYSASCGIQDTDVPVLALWHFEVNSSGVVTLNKIDNTGAKTINTEAVIKYRKIGEA